MLVVDDESHISHVVSLKLQQAGLNVIVAADGEEALEVAMSQRPALVVTDFQMPFLSGLELGKRLRQDPALAGVPVLMLTARGHLLPADELAQTNIKAVMCKPFAPRLLLDKVLELLGRGAFAGETPGAIAA